MTNRIRTISTVSNNESVSSGQESTCKKQKDLPSSERTRSWREVIFDPVSVKLQRNFIEFLQNFQPTDTQNTNGWSKGSVFASDTNRPLVVLHEGTMTANL